MSESIYSQRYSIDEAAERIYRSLRGDVLDDTPNRLAPPTRSTAESLSRIAELLNDSLPGEQLSLKIKEILSGSGTNYISISSGSFYMAGDTTVWDDMRFPATSFALGQSNPPGLAVFKTNGAGSQGVFTYWFDASSEEELYMIAQMPHSWKLGSNLYPHVHWTPASSNTGTVSWGLEYSWASINGVFPNTSIIYGNQNLNGFVNISGSVHYLTSLPVITGTSQGISSMLIMRLFRNATGGGSSGDSYPADAGLLEFDIHYEMDTLGSSTELAK